MGDKRFVTGDFAFVTPKKAKELKSNIARPGDIIVTQRGTLGQVAIIHNNRISSRVHYFPKPNEDYYR